MLSSPSNPTLKYIRVLQSKRREREREQAFIIEGVRLFEEAARANVVPRLVLHTEDLDARGRAALDALAAHGGDVHPVTPAAMAAASDTETPSGLLAVIPFPSFPSFATLSFAIVCDRLADPGNLGTILRTADAAGVEAVFLAPGTVDAFNPKVVRAAMGAHFHLPVMETTWEALRERLSGMTAWLADSASGDRYDRVDWRAACALLIGSEAEGPSAEASAFATRRVHIPMPGRAVRLRELGGARAPSNQSAPMTHFSNPAFGQAESLNAAIAAGVLMFEVARQRQPGDTS